MCVNVICTFARCYLSTLIGKKKRLKNWYHSLVSKGFRQGQRFVCNAFSPFSIRFALFLAHGFRRRFAMTSCPVREVMMSSYLCRWISSRRKTGKKNCVCSQSAWNQIVIQLLAYQNFAALFGRQRDDGHVGKMWKHSWDFRRNHRRGRRAADEQ